MEAHKRSGLSVSAYAREQGLNLNSFCNARTRLSARSVEEQTSTTMLFRRVAMSPSTTYLKKCLHLILEIRNSKQ